MKSFEKGEYAQLKVELRAIEKNMVASKPLVPSRYDLILDDSSRLWRVQVKYADGKTNSENSVRMSLNYTDRAGKEHAYSTSQVDAVIAYIPRIDKLLWLTADEIDGKMKIEFRVAGGRRATGNWFEDYLW